MKKYIILTAILGAGVAFTSCNDYLDKLPDNRMELKNATELADLLVSAYPTKHPAYLYEMYSDNTDCMDNTGWTEAEKFQREAYEWADITEISADETPKELWDGHYKAISAANSVIQGVENLSEAQQQEAKQQLGEALMCRAYSMFVLVNTFCMPYSEATAAKEMGLPYPTETETKVGQVYERGTLAACYDQMNADIEKALPLVGNTYSNPKYHFNADAAYAFAARFNLFYGKYDKTIQYASKVLGSNPAQVLRDWATLKSLSMNSQIQPQAYVDSSEKANLLLLSVYSQWGAVSGPYRFGDRYAHGEVLATTEDLKVAGPWGSYSGFNYSVWSNSALSKQFLRRVLYMFEYTDIQAGIGYAHSAFPVFNTDVLLMERAEAYALSGNYQAAVDDINTELSKFRSDGKTVTVAGIKTFYNGVKAYTPAKPTVKKTLNPVFTTLDADTQEPVIQTVLQLRRLLTMHEGYRWLDVKRYGIEIYRRTYDNKKTLLEVTDSMKVDDLRRAIQLPQDVIKAGIPQNPRN